MQIFFRLHLYWLLLCFM